MISLVPLPENVAERRIAMLEVILGIFIALGRGLTIADRIICQNAWNGYSDADCERGYLHATGSVAEWQTRPTNKIAQPWNYICGKHWEREAPRLLTQLRQPTRREENSVRAAKSFMEGE